MLKSLACVFILLAVTCQAVKIQSSAQLALRDKLVDLKKTTWGNIAVNLLDLQLKTNGPLAELVTAFKNLISDLNFKQQSTQEDYRFAKGEHYTLDLLLNKNIKNAQVRLGVAQRHLVVLNEQRVGLETQIKTAEDLVAFTEEYMRTETANRAASQALFETNHEEHVMSLDAVAECVTLVEGLQNGGSFIEIKKAEKNIKALQNKIRVKGPIAHLALALVQMSQDFADNAGVAKVLTLLNDLSDNLADSLVQLVAANTEEIKQYEHQMVVSQNTIDEQNALLVTLNASLDVCLAEIAHQEDLRDVAHEDETTNQDSLDVETARWAAYVASYEALMAELTAEHDAVGACLDVFANANLDEGMVNVLNTL